MDLQYAIVTCLDKLTGLKYKDKLPQLLQSVMEDIDMYNRHNNKNILFGYDILGTYNDIPDQYNDVKFLIPKKYIPNPFNSCISEQNHPRLISYLGLPMIVVSDQNMDEFNWVKSYIDRIAYDLYNQCVKDKTDYYKIYGSLCHHGFLLTTQ